MRANISGMRFGKLLKEAKMKFFRYSKANGSINIGTKKTKLTIFTREHCFCFTFNGNRVAHFGKGWNK